MQGWKEHFTFWHCKVSLDPPEIRQGRLSCSIIRSTSFHRSFTFKLVTGWLFMQLCSIVQRENIRSRQLWNVRLVTWFVVKGRVRGHSDGCGFKITGWGVGSAWSGLPFKWTEAKHKSNTFYWSTLNKFHVIIQLSVTERNSQDKGSRRSDGVLIWMTSHWMM